MNELAMELHGANELGNILYQLGMGPSSEKLMLGLIRSAKRDDNYGASNIILPCPGS